MKKKERKKREKWVRDAALRLYAGNGYHETRPEHTPIESALLIACSLYDKSKHLPSPEGGKEKKRG